DSTGPQAGQHSTGVDKRAGSCTRTWAAWGTPAHNGHPRAPGPALGAHLSTIPHPHLGLTPSGPQSVGRPALVSCGRRRSRDATPLGWPEPAELCSFGMGAAMESGSYRDGAEVNLRPETFTGQ